MKITTKITLDLQRPNFATEVEVMQDDGETRILEISLASGGTAWNVPAGIFPVVVFRRPNGTKGMYDKLADGSPAVTTEGSTVTVVLSRQMLAIPGLVQASLQFEDAQLNQLTTFPFRVNVQANPYGGAQSVQDVVRLQWLEEKMDEYLKKAAESGEFVGPPGPQGIPGKDGAPGEQGLQGLPGKDGAVGPAGPAGKDGAAGPTGPVGPQGPAGNTGPAGVTGPAGKSAYQIAVDGGFVGNEEAWLASLIGPRGAQGERGATGQQGAQGPAGKDGAAGERGPQGPQGIPGKDGAPGEQGPQGPIGPKGPPADLMGDAKGPIRMNGQPLTGLNPPTGETEAATKGYVDGAVRKAAPCNLLDNSDFRNPVNQRGQTSSDQIGSYWIDRWRSNNAIYLDMTGCIGINAVGSVPAGLTQVIANHSLYYGKKLTLAVCARSSGGKLRLAFPYVSELQNIQLNPDWGIYTFTTAFIQNESNTAGVYAESGSAIDVQWAAIYEGEYTAETLPEYQPKGYGAELAECQRYYQIRSANNIAAVDMRPTMRLTSPTITSVTGGYAYSADL